MTQCVSLQFVRVSRDEPVAANKGAYWRLAADQEEQLITNAFTKKRRQLNAATAAAAAAAVAQGKRCCRTSMSRAPR